LGAHVEIDPLQTLQLVCATSTSSVLRCQGIASVRLPFT
jgi:hypothetical protein